MKILVIKDNGVLRPLNEEAEEVFARIKRGSTLVADLVQPRDPVSLARYHALVQILWENQEIHKTREDYHKYIKSRLNVESISFENMGEVEFADFWERLSDLVADEIMPGVSSQTLWEEINQRI